MVAIFSCISFTECVRDRAQALASPPQIRHVRGAKPSSVRVRGRRPLALQSNTSRSTRRPQGSDSSSLTIRRLSLRASRVVSSRASVPVGPPSVDWATICSAPKAEMARAMRWSNTLLRTREVLTGPGIAIVTQSNEDAPGTSAMRRACSEALCSRASSIWGSSTRGPSKTSAANPVSPSSATSSPLLRRERKAGTRTSARPPDLAVLTCRRAWPGRSW